MNKDADNIINLYRRHATTFAARRSQSLMEKSWLDRFAGLLAPNASVLDLGCGTGAPIAQYLLGQGFVVHGVDAAPEMIELAATSFPQGHWSVADMRDLSLGQRFDGVLAWNSFFHLTPEDQQKMFAVFRQHCAPGGALMFTSGTHHGIAMGVLEGEPLYHASLDPQGFRDLLSETGFSVIDHVAQDADCGGHTVWLAQRD